MSKTGNKIYTLTNNNNYYTGNNIEFIKAVMKSNNKNLHDIKNILSSRKTEAEKKQNIFAQGVDKNTFLFSYIKFDDNSFMRVILTMMLLHLNPDMYSIINNIRSIDITGKKIDNYFTFNMNIQTTPSQ